MRRLGLYLTLMITALLAPWQQSIAQMYEDGDEYEELDYRDFKFYKEEPEQDISLWGGLNDTLTLESKRRSFVPNHYYALTYASNTYRGQQLSKSTNLFAYTEIDYTTLRTLKGLGYATNEQKGITQANLSASIGRTTTILTDADQYDRQYISINLTGKDYLIGISHNGAYSVNQYGVPLKEGWTITEYERVRTGRDLYVEGVYNNSVDIALGATYNGRNEKFDIIVALPWSERGLRQASTDEAFTLTNNRLYNPTWGMQNGKVRNSRVATSLRPEIIALWQRKLSAATSLTLVANTFFEHMGTSSLTAFNAPSTTPDNYKYMPSYFSDIEQSEVAKAWTTNDLRYTQIDWDRLYHTNYIQQDGSARYAVTIRHRNLTHIAINAGLKSQLGTITLNYGAELQGNSERRFRVMDDLMGAAYIRDIDYHIMKNDRYSHLNDNNLRDPNDIVHEGDRYGYDYRLGSVGVKLYATAEWSISNFDFWMGIQMTPELYWRRGYFEKELFAGNASYGRSEKIALTPAMLNASCRYNIDNHNLSAAFMVRTISPNRDDMFLQPDYNNRLIARPELATTISAELTYSYFTRGLRLNASLYLNSISRETDVIRYYDDLSSENCDAVVSGIGHIHYGIEATAEATWSRLFSSSFAVNIAQYRYHRNPTVTTYTDDDNTLIATSVANMRGHHVGAPEIALYGDICFRHNGWVARASVNYWALGYVSPSMVRRTERIISFAASTEEREALQHQHQLPNAATLDLALSKRFNINEDTSLSIQLSARNILGTNIVYSSYEENRISMRTVGNHTITAPYANRLTYAYPRLFSLSVSLRF